MANVFTGLDLSQLDSITEGERREFRAFFEGQHGNPHKGLSYLLDNRPDALKRFRLVIRDGIDSRPVGFGFLLLYALLGYSVGVRYIVRGLQNKGMTREQCNDAFALCLLYCGPRGLETIADALEDYDWMAPEAPVAFPENWAPDPEAFEAGLDFSTMDLSVREQEKVRAWYLRWAGEVPDYVGFMAEHEPRLLKIQRSRFETCLKVLPKQVLPYTMIQFNVVRGYAPGTREALLLARGFGVSKELALKAINTCLEYGGVESLSMVHQAAGDVFETWDRGV